MAWPGKRVAPELACDHGHLGLDPEGFPLGVGKHLVGRDARVELEVELLDESVAADPPGLRGARKDLVPEECQVVLESGHDRSGPGAKLSLPGRLAGQREELTV